MKRFALALPMFSLVFLASATVFSKEGPKVVNANAFGSTPNITIRTVPSGAAPWVVDNGRIQLSPSGKLKVQIKGLVIGEGALASGDPVPPSLVGTVATVTMVHAALTCGGPGGGTPFTVTSTDAVPISSSGDVEITDHLTIPSVCAQPIVLIRIGAAGAAAGPWIAASELPGAPRN
jgi:hypothetical protein